MTDSVSLQEVLEETKELETIANAVLGDSDDSCCTYDQGYVGRQALYACITCTGHELAGICLACSLYCHDGHQLYELYTKRRFRCDCGNLKFPLDFKCNLQPAKERENVKNKYGRNFRGLYCSCNRPFPDPDDEIEDEMIQCIVCEDWFHARHLGISPPENDQYDEMVCDSCANQFPFLEAYSIHSSPTLVETEGNESVVDAVGENNDSDVEQLDVCILAKWKRTQVASQGFVLKTLYFNVDWRKRICRCPSCMERYHEVDFLLDEEDTISAYERRGVARGPPPDTHDAGMAALMTSFSHTQQVELLHGYATMKEDLVDFLKDFSQTGKVVTERDIADFFEGLKARKKLRLDSGAGIPPSYCHQ